MPYMRILFLLSTFVYLSLSRSTVLAQTPRIQDHNLIIVIQALGSILNNEMSLAVDIPISVQKNANLCEVSASHTVLGAVEAGIDLTGITAQDIYYDQGRNVYVLTLPAPQLTSCHIDYLRQYERSDNTCEVDWDELRILANYEGLVQIRDRALENGILDATADKVGLIISTFIHALTGTDVEIAFRQIESYFPASCSATIPEAWKFNAVSQYWVKKPPIR